jgi:RecB family endonuclease NucS
VRLVVARCKVTYSTPGGLSTGLPEAVRLLMLKDDGLFLVHDDAGGYKPQNWVRSVFRPNVPRPFQRLVVAHSR